FFYIIYYVKPIMNKRYSYFMLAGLAVAALFFINTTASLNAQDTESEMKNIQTRDQITVLLEGKNVSPNAHIHLYDTGSYHIMDGHISVNIPCNDDSEPLLDVMGGIAGSEYFMKKMDIHPVANMSMPGDTCMYHTEIVSEMGTNGWLYSDITLRNPSDEPIEFPPNSVAIVGVNEIMQDPADAPEAQGSMTLQERGSSGMANMGNMTDTN
ncbi:MAG: hypothetical protein ACPKPY_00030, partial [Nitrososphaeraceae archaeon]